MSKKNLLLVEDDASYSWVLSRALNKLGYTVHNADQCEPAIDLAQRHQPQYIILDLMLHNKSSLTLVPKLISIYEKTQILILTGYASITTAVQAIKLGAKNYLPKPATIEEIHQALTLDATEFSKPLKPNSSQPSLKQMEWEYIQKTLEKNQGNVSATAKQLQMHRRTLQRKLKKKLSLAIS